MTCRAWSRPRRSSSASTWVPSTSSARSGVSQARSHAGMQRVSHAGHQVDEPSRGRIFPKFRGDLLECAVVAGPHASVA